jgi:hypothetical protein
MNPRSNLSRHQGELQEPRQASTDHGKILGEGADQRRNHYGCSHPDAVVLAMRYVIVICAVTFFLIWDGIYNQGRYLDTTVREITRIVRYITSLV